MEYPKHILPKKHFKRISWHESLNDHSLIHFTDQKEIIDPVTKKLDIKYVVKQTDHLRDYSNNLLGVFEVDDIYWAVQDCPRKIYFTTDWEEGKEVDIPNVPEEFDRIETRGYFFLKIGECHNEIVKFSDDGFMPRDPVCRVLHTPTNSNFWHISLRWKFECEDLEIWTTGIKRRMKTSAKSFIIEKAFFDEPYYKEVDSRLYSIKSDCSNK